MPRPRTVVIAAGLFLFFCILKFPYSNLKGVLFQKIYAATGITLLAESIYPSFFGWPGIGIRNVQVSLPVGRDEITLASEKLIFRVGLSRLIPPVPSVSLSMDGLKGGGDLSLGFSQTSTWAQVKFEAEEVSLGQIKYASLPEPFLGKLEADGWFRMDTTDVSKSIGDIGLEIKQFKTPTFSIPMSPTYSFAIPEMKISSVQGRISVKNGMINIGTLQIGDEKSDLHGQLTGDIKLGSSWMTSAVNLTLKFRLSREYVANPQAVTLLSTLNTFKSETTGGYGLRCRASIDDIVNRFVCAIPEKVE